MTYAKGSGTLVGAPRINHETLKAKGLTEEEIAKVEEQLAGVFEIQFAFNVWTLGEDTLKRLGIAESEYNDFNFNMLRALGFTREDIEAANEYVCGSMTIEGAPHLKEEHYPVFDCANRCGKKGQRFIHHNGHIRMMAAVQPFLSGAISKTINMPNEVNVKDIKDSYMLSWKLGLKATALYRDGCKLSQPLSTSSGSDAKDEVEQSNDSEAETKAATTTVQLDQSVVHQCADGTTVMQGRRKLPVKRSGMTVEAQVGNQQVYIRTGEYPDGQLGEVFIDMFREGAAFRSLLNCFAVAVSYGLQYGVPLEKFVDKFTFTRFDPSGFTTHPNVKMCTSVIDYVFRVLAMEYEGRNDLVQVPPKGTQKNRVDALKELIELRELAHGVTPVSEGQEDLFANTTASNAETVVEETVVEDAIVHTETTTVSSQQAGAHSSMDALLEEMMGDAPLCETCGHITVRNGSCYRCLNCGNSMGCS